MLEIFNGQLSINDLKHNLVYKEALMLRDIRLERRKKEREEIESERQREEERQRREASKRKIILP